MNHVVSHVSETLSNAAEVVVLTAIVVDLTVCAWVNTAINKVSTFMKGLFSKK